MKRILIIVFLMLSALPLCVNAQKTPTDVQEFSIPCVADSYDTEKAVGAWGYAKSLDQGEAYSLASKDAIESLARRFHVNSRAIEKEADMWCRKVTQNENKEYVVYVSIRVSKSALSEIMKNNNQ